MHGLLRQADLFAESFHPWIAMKQREFRGVESAADPNGAAARKRSKAPRVLLIAQTGKDQSLLERVAKEAASFSASLRRPALP